MATPSLKRNRHISTSPSPAKKKNVFISNQPDANIFSIETEINSSPVMEMDDSQDTCSSVAVDKVFVFKDPNFVHSSVGTAGNKKTRLWKNLKQIVTAEKALPWQPDDTTYGMIDAPPSFKPAMKYSDISGLPAYYTDPQTKLRYSTAEEYARIKMMPGDLVTGCLLLRRANVVV